MHRWARGCISWVETAGICLQAQVLSICRQEHTHAHIHVFSRFASRDINSSLCREKSKERQACPVLRSGCKHVKARGGGGEGLSSKNLQQKIMVSTMFRDSGSRKQVSAFQSCSTFLLCRGFRRRRRIFLLQVTIIGASRKRVILR